ncbi:MAG: hypothetical protein SVR94_03680 [Pseudomonadota bacterium]|nr:hypothetical protein [Pseudomonadota bacterium]
MLSGRKKCVYITLIFIATFKIAVASMNSVATPTTTTSTETQSAENNDGSYVAGNILKINGWYERYANGQLVLYPVEGNSSMNSMFGMSGMSGMFGMSGMTGMSGMSSMFGMSSMTGMLGMSGQGSSYKMTFGRFWISPDGHLILYPVKGMSMTGK